MKKAILLIIAISILLPSCSIISPQRGIKEVSPESVTNLLNKEALFVDVREADEVVVLAYDLPGVIYIPLSELPDRMNELPRDQPILLACRSGKRSMKAANLLSGKGYNRLYSLNGGIIGWQAEGRSVIKAAALRAGGYPDVNVVGAMRNVMWKGQLKGSIELDTITNKKGLYGLGPLSYLTGEILVNNGISYVSKVTPDSGMMVDKNFTVTAPFFVYTNVTEWEKMALPATVKTIPDLEEFIDANTADYKRPFAFKLTGKVEKANIHIQNLPTGTKVSSPRQAHQGQVSYELGPVDAEIIGFFSTEHQGIFTHHDSILHMHLITEDERRMGHLDELEIGSMTLYLPKK